MNISVLTLFPQMFESPLGASIVKRAVDRELVKISITNIRDYAEDKHKTADDYPYGGGAGMVMKPEPIFKAVEAVKAAPGEDYSKAPVILLTPQGRLFSQKIAAEFAALPAMILLCGHYEGVDERVCRHLATDEISIGDYVLSGGELAAMVVIDAVVRLLPGALGSAESAVHDSHSAGLLEHPHYTRPPVFQGWEVPEALLSGNHADIARWRREQSILRTATRRPDLLKNAEMTGEERRLAQDAQKE